MEATSDLLQSDPLQKALRLKNGRDLALLLFGTKKYREVGSEINRICDEALGAGVQKILYARPNTAFPLGVKLVSGKEVALKLHIATQVDAAWLTAIRDMQATLFAHGMPCPQPLAPLFVTDRAVVTFDSVLRLPKPVNARLPKNRNALARGLNEFVEISTASKGGKRLQRLPHGRIAVTISNPETPFSAFESHRFPLSKTEKKAVWINEFALASIEQAAGVRSRKVVGHFDWRIENVRLRGGTIAAILDMDSIAAAPEFEVVGTAAALHPINYEGRYSGPPTPLAMTAFVEEYERERKKVFSDRERDAIAAAATWALASVARRELVDDPKGQHLKRSCREALMRYGNRYLEI